jgi:hypothetical protein
VYCNLAMEEEYMDCGHVRTDPEWRPLYRSAVMAMQRENVHYKGITLNGLAAHACI